MFGIAFSELIIIAIVALVVIGPERLPSVARTVGHLLGRARRYVNEVKASVENELRFEDLRQLRSKFEESALSVQAEIRKSMTNLQDELQEPLFENIDEIAAEESQGYSDAPPAPEKHEP